MPKNNNKKNPKEEEESEESEHEEEEEEDEEDGEIDLSELPKNVFRVVKAVRKLHSEEFEALDEEYEKERLALEKKYEVKKQAYYAKRNPLISGEVAVKKEEGVEEEGTEETDDKGIPQFWITVLTSHPAIAETVTEEDVSALEALTNVTVAYDEDYTAFTLTFHFAENEFFTNKTLTKRYVVSPSLLDDKNPSLSDVDGCTIDWKPSKNLCVTEVKKKQKAKAGRNKGQVRTVTKTEPKRSFFHYFDEHTGDDEEEEEEDEEEDEEAVVGKKKFTPEEDYDIGHTIRTTLIPEAILWFTGENHDDDFYGGDDEDDDEEEDDEEEDEEEEDKGKKAKGKKAAAATGFAAAPGAPGQQQPECKQN